jgi:hypothetical protein
MKTLILSFALLAGAAHAADLAQIQAVDAQIAALKAARAAAVKTLDPVSRAELRLLQAQEGLAKAQERAGKAPKAPRQGKTRAEVLL